MDSVDRKEVMMANVQQGELAVGEEGEPMTLMERTQFGLWFEFNGGNPFNLTVIISSLEMARFSHGHPNLTNPSYGAKRNFLRLDLRLDGLGHWWPGGGWGHSLP